MQETNGNPQNQTSNQEICTIRIMFPVDSDEQAIEFKKKITNILSEIPEAAINFSLMTGRPPMPPTKNDT